MFFPLPPHILNMGEGLARAGTGTDPGPAAGAAGSNGLSVLDMFGAVMPRELDSAPPFPGSGALQWEPDSRMNP